MFFLALCNQEQLEDCAAVWLDATKGLVHIVTSTLTIAEVIYMKGTPKLDPSKRSFMTNFFRRKFISLIPVTRSVAELARDIVWDFNIHPKDAVHVATCVACKVGEMHSFDKVLVSKDRLDINGFEIAVEHPRIVGQSDMFSGKPLL